MSTLTEPALEPGLRHALTFRIEDLEFRKVTSTRSDNYTLRGHAAVFNSLSEDLGGFRETIEPQAFRTALRGTPDVRLLFNHDPNKVLARTTAHVDGKPSLELREDATGLHVWAVIQPRTWVNDLAVEMSGGLIDQMSFAFSIREGGDDWEVQEDESVLRTIRADGIDGLYDVSVVTYPAYPASEVGIRELRNAVALGRLPATVLGESDELNISEPRAVDVPEAEAHDIQVVVEEPTAPTLQELRELSRAALQAERERHLHAMKELLK